MQKYIGTKVIEAMPMTREDAEAKLGRTIGGKQTGDGYLVKYPDDFESWSPKDVFEEAYRQASGITFGLAIEALKKGLKVARAGWNGKGMWLELQTPDEHSKMTLPYIYLNYPDNSVNTPGARVPWLASQTDVLSDDWAIVK